MNEKQARERLRHLVVAAGKAETTEAVTFRKRQTDCGAVSITAYARGHRLATGKAHDEAGAYECLAEAVCGGEFEPFLCLRDGFTEGGS